MFKSHIYFFFNNTKILVLVCLGFFLFFKLH